MTSSWFAVVIAIGVPNVQVTAVPPAIEQAVYVALPDTIFALAVPAVALSVNVTESMSVGVVALS